MNYFRILVPQLPQGLIEIRCPAEPRGVFGRFRAFLTRTRQSYGSPQLPNATHSSGSDRAQFRTHAPRPSAPRPAASTATQQEAT